MHSCQCHPWLEDLGIWVSWKPLKAPRRGLRRFQGLLMPDSPSPSSFGPRTSGSQRPRSPEQTCDAHVDELRRWSTQHCQKADVPRAKSEWLRTETLSHNLHESRVRGALGDDVPRKRSHVAEFAMITREMMHSNQGFLIILRGFHEPKAMRPKGFNKLRSSHPRSTAQEDASRLMTPKAQLEKTCIMY